MPSPSILIALPALALVGGAAVAAGPTPADAADRGTAEVTVRLRAESVNQTGLADALGLTLRTLLGYETRTWRHWSLRIAAEDVTVIGDDDFNNAGAGPLGNGRTDRAVIADVELTELDEAVARLDLPRWDLAVGRQAVNVADQRLLGAVGWRQNHQSFDAVRLDTTALGPWSVTYLYLDRVHRVLGDRRDTGAHYLQGQVPVGGATLRGYGLHLSSSAGLGPGTRTLGLEITGEAELGARRWAYEIEAAQQDGLSGAAPVDAGYLHLMMGTGLGPVTARLGLEVLEGSPERGRFTTPLATLHKFNGWADKFLQTPDDGLEDLYLSLSGSGGRWKWTVSGHRFRAESAPLDLGEELDGMLTWQAPWDQTFGLKLAEYSADRHATDTTKWMLWSELSF